MLQSTFTKKGKLSSYSLIALIAILTMSFGPMFMGPGLTDAEPVGKFFNGTFPAIGFTQDPYEVAYSNITFDSPLNYTTVPGQARIVVGQRNGEVFWFDDNDNATVKNPLIDLSAEVGIVWDGGFLGLSIHPDFGTPGKNFFYVYYTTKSADTTLESPLAFSCGVERFHGNYLQLERFEVNPADLSYVSNSRTTMFKLQMYNTTHRGGGMEFGDDGFLYLSTGDQAAYRNAQDIGDNLDGGVLRLDVDMDPTKSHAPIRLMPDDAGESDEFSGVGYWIPNDNPFNNADGSVFEEYYSMGHRNPHRMTKDRNTGVFYIGEIGENTHEEINVLSIGKNYGWPLFEATADTPEPGCVTELYNNMPHEEPLVEFIRTEARAIIGGYVYRGSNVSDLAGKYICADYILNNIFTVDINTGEKQNIGTFAPGNIISFGQDYQGELYMLKQGDNVNLYRLAQPGLDYSSIPATLADIGAFTDLQDLTVAQGFLPYDMIDPFWSDGAYKKRWMMIPNDGTHDSAAEQITFSENGDWDFPAGTVLIKHFDYPIDDNDPSITRKVETRFSIKGDNGEFYFLTYNWNEAQTNATLQEVGLDEPIQISTVGGGTRQVNWRFPSNGECLSCHNPALGGTLGPRTRYLNSDYDYSSHDAGGTMANQLVTLSHLGVLNENITDTDTPNYLTHKSIDDPLATLEEKARSYLDLNCAYCHQPATGNRADFDLRLINTLAQTGLLNAGVNSPLGLAPDEEIVFEGDASKSILYHRTNSVDPTIMMPPLAKGQIDADGVALLEQWINGLQPQADIPDFGIYRLVNTGTGQSLQVENSSDVDGGNVNQGNYQVLESQHFELENAIGGFYQFKAVHSNKYVDVASSNTNPGANVWQFAGNGTDAQLWEILDAGNDSFYIVSKLSGYFLGVQPDGNVAVMVDDGSDIFRWQFRETGSQSGRDIVLNKNIISTSEDGTSTDFEVQLGAQPTGDIILDVQAILGADEVLISDAQLTFTDSDWNIPQTLTLTGVDDLDIDGPQPFIIEIIVNNASADEGYEGYSKQLEGLNSDNDGGGVAPPDPGVYRIVNVSSDLTMEVLAASIDDFANIQQGSYQEEDHENFTLSFLGNGQYIFEAVHSGKLMDVAFSNTDPGANVIQFRSNGSDAQLWSISDAGDNSFHIISELSGHYLTIDVDGNIMVDIDDGSDMFKWRFSDIALSNAGIAVNVTEVFTNENGDSETFEVMLESQPTGEVTLGLVITGDNDEATLSTNQLMFDTNDWDIPQEVTVTGVDDADVDGVRDYFIEINTVAPFNDPNYNGIGATIIGKNLDNDGGDNGPPRAGVYRLVNVETGETIRAEGGGVADQTNFVSGTYTGDDFQHFELEYDGNDYFKLKAIHSDKYFDVQFSDTNPGANIWQFTSNNTDAQKWELQYISENTYHIVSKLSGYYTTIGAANNIEVQPNDDSDIFKWQFLPTGFPPEAIAVADVLTGNAPMQVQFTGDGSTDDKNDIVSYLWDFGNGDTSTELNPLYTYTLGGQFDVTLTVTDGDGYSDVSDILVIDVNAAPQAVASSNLDNGTAPLEVSFTGSGSSDDEMVAGYSWDFGDGGNSTDADPTYTFNSAGVWTVILTVTDGEGLSDTAELTITVEAPNEAPVAVATSSINNGIAPLEVEFTGSNSTDDVAIESYSWDFGDGGTSTEANPTYTFNNDGIWAVTLTVTDDEGLSDTEELTIEVGTPNEAPVAVASSNIDNGSSPLQVDFIGSGSSDDVMVESYSWDFGDGGSSTDADPGYTFVNEGTWTVTLTVTDGEGLSDTAELTITVEAPNEAPLAVATSNVDNGIAPLEVEFTGSNSTDDVGVESYSWDFGDGGSSTESDPTYTFDNDGSWTVTLTVTDDEGLTNSTEITIEVLENGVNDAIVEAILSPNPSAEYVEIALNDMIDSNIMTKMTLHDMSGRLIAEYQPSDIYLSEDLYRIDIFDLRTGIYVVTIILNEGDPISKQFIKR